MHFCIINTASKFLSYAFWCNVLYLGLNFGVSLPPQDYHNNTRLEMLFRCKSNCYNQLGIVVAQSSLQRLLIDVNLFLLYCPSQVYTLILFLFHLQLQLSIPLMMFSSICSHPMQ